MVPKINVWIFSIAGLCLAFFITGCQNPVYRLDGQAPQSVAQVALLDRSATGAIDSIRTVFRQTWDLMVLSREAAIDSVSQSASSLGGPIARAQKDLQDEQAKYRQAFLQMQRFRSFGGNPVFSEEDIAIATETLLLEIAGRFYKGRALSLETVRQIRTYIKRTLAPLEKDVQQVRARVNRLKRSLSSRTQDEKEIIAKYEKQKNDLVVAVNEDIATFLDQHKLQVADVDSLGSFEFEKLVPGHYHLFVNQEKPLGYLVPVQIARHTRQDLAKELLRPIYVEVASDN